MLKIPRLVLGLCSIAALLAAASRADAKSPFKPGNGAAPIDIRAEIIGMSGLGCPSGGASAVVSADGGSVSILFDKMSTELAPLSAEKKMCSVRLGFRFSGQYRVAVVGSDARGFVSVPEGGVTTLTVQHYSIFTIKPEHLRRMNLTKTFVGPRSEEVILHSDFRDIPMWSYCGTQMRGQPMQIMSINLTIDSNNQNAAENLLAVVDSLDIGGPATLTYQLVWTHDKKNCPR